MVFWPPRAPISSAYLPNGRSALGGSCNFWSPTSSYVKGTPLCPLLNQTEVI